MPEALIKYPWILAREYLIKFRIEIFFDLTLYLKNKSIKFQIDFDFGLESLHK